MAPSTLDLFMLTFNCAKNLVNAAVFSSHLQAALSQNATGLPHLVVFSLQEIAPLSYSFIGSYFLNPYYSRFEEALNLAAAKVLTAADNGNDPGFSHQTGGSQGQGRAPYPYTLVRAKNVGMTAIMLFTRTPASIHHIEEAECGFGAADMGNKGAVGLRVTWTSGAGEVGPTVERKTTELTFVATHLAAMEWNLKKRNSNWRTIASSLTFANPKRLLPGVFPANQSNPTPDRTGTGNVPPPPKTDSADSSEAEEEEGAPLLSVDAAADDLSPIEPSHPDFPDMTATHHATLHDISIFKPSTHLFIGGDLNYRISTTTPPPLSAFPSFDPDSENHYPRFLARDQLTQERNGNRTFHGMSEAPVRFGPTYKFNILPDADGAVNEVAVRRGATVNGVAEVPWRFASHRWPGWCDRILYLDVPGWVSSQGAKAPSKIDVQAYDGIPIMRTSDHRPVFLRARVPLIEPDAMRPPETFNTPEERTDPRATLPLPIDVHAWERRAAARRRELVVGWTAFFWSTREGAMVLASFLLLVVGSWWVYKMW